MSITETISQTAATNPVVGVAVATQSTNSAILGDCKREMPEPKPC